MCVRERYPRAHTRGAISTDVVVTRVPFKKNGVNRSAAKSKKRIKISNSWGLVVAKRASSKSGMQENRKQTVVLVKLYLGSNFNESTCGNTRYSFVRHTCICNGGVNTDLNFAIYPSVWEQVERGKVGEDGRHGKQRERRGELDQQRRRAELPQVAALHSLIAMGAARTGRGRLAKRDVLLT